MLNDRQLFVAVCFFAAIMTGLCIGYAVYTGHVWEDFLITYRCSWNLAEGNGLVYRSGERVHAYTSAINTLLPAAFHKFFGTRGSEDYLLEIWLYRIVSMCALTAGGVLGLATVSYANRLLLGFAFAAIALLAEPKSIMFAMNGQEAGFLYLFLGLSCYSMLCSGETKRGWLWTGMAWAGLMYTRPDSPVYILSLLIGSVVMNKVYRRQMMHHYLRAAILCTALYLPWFSWVWVYYGNPIPHTIQAKALMSGVDFETLEIIREVAFKLPDVSSRAFLPTYHELSGWPAWLKPWAFLAAIVPLCYFAFPSRDSVGRALSLAFACVCIYIAYVAVKAYAYPWYFPPATFFGILTWGRILGQLQTILANRLQKCDSSDSLEETRNSVRFYGRLTFLLVAVLLTPLIFQQWETWRQIQFQQAVIETGHRREIGLYLRENVGATETVFLECLGYIGFYSRARMLDFPGLSSPAVVNTLRTVPRESRNMSTPVRLLKPDWLVLRPHELKRVFGTAGNIDAMGYELVKEFNVSERVKKQKHRISGLGYLMFDSTFMLFRLKAAK